LKKRHIMGCDIEIDQPLRWDVHDEAGGLLVRQGYVIRSQSQRENLIERGWIMVALCKVAPAEPPSVLRMLKQASVELEAALHQISAGVPGAAGALDAVAGLVTSALTLNQDVALACILHNQRGASYAVRHSVDTALLALILARALKKSEADTRPIVLAALTMNVGMLQHQERLQHCSSPLTASDADIIQGHVEAGVALLRQSGVEDQAWLTHVLEHHEKEDGTGYPRGKPGVAISEGARIISLADRYCARVCARGYRKPMLPNAALRDLLLHGRHPLEAQLITLLIHELGVYPIGTYVRLLNGEVGVVTRRGLSSTMPHVDALVGPRGAPLEVAVRRDTGVNPHTIREVLTEEMAAIGFRLDQLWGRVASD
jgi:hypothetical protein